MKANPDPTHFGFLDFLKLIVQGILLLVAAGVMVIGVLWFLVFLGRELNTATRGISGFF